MFRLLMVFAVLILVSGCNKNETENKTGTEQQVIEESPAPKQDVSDQALLAIDPEIQRFIDVCMSAKQGYEAGKNEKSKAALINAYIAFGDYMTYESPVSPRKGKYHRALIEYRHALELDPQNEKAKKEILQIEDIYRSMGRPIPSDA